jgi:outer membrane receptor protein involved in Fe transport
LSRIAVHGDSSTLRVLVIERSQFRNPTGIRLMRAFGHAFTTLIAALVVLCGSFAGADAQARSVTYNFDIPSQGLNAALQQFALTAQHKLLYRTELVDGKTSESLKGQFTVEEAVRKLLSGSGLTFEITPSAVVLIKPDDKSMVATHAAPMNPGRGEGAGSGSAFEEGAGADDGVRPAQGEQLADENGDDEKSATKPTRDVVLQPDIRAAIPEVLVKGSRVLNADIRRTEDDAQPYVVFGGDEITESQAGSIEEFLRTRLPMNTQQGTAGQNFEENNRSQFNLRGLGTNQTLVLVDGRRLPRSFATSGNDPGGFNQPDLNGIPIAAIERIEVLPSTASGIYGGGATGGVINVVLKRDYQGTEVRAIYGETFRSDAGTGSFSLSSGFTLGDGDLQVLLMASHSEADPLHTGDRDFVRRANALNVANVPDVYTNGVFAFFPALGFTSNICGGTFFCDGTPLVLDNGTELNSSITHVPTGYSGPGSDNGSALLQNAGQYNTASPNDQNGQRSNLLSESVVDSASVNLRREFHEAVDGFLNVSWYRNKGQAGSFGAPSSILLPASAPNNPFTSDVIVAFPTPELSLSSVTDDESLQSTAGVIVRLAKNWSLAGEYNWSRVAAEERSTSLFLSQQFSTDLTNGTLDVLRDLNVSPLDYGAYLAASPNIIQGPIDTVLNDIVLRVSGPLFDLPAGPVTVTGLLERRTEEVGKSFSDLIFDTSSFITYLPRRSQDVDSLYAEARIPVFGELNVMSLLRELEIQASVRRDEYRTVSVPTATLVVPSRDGPLPTVMFTSNTIEETDYTLGLRYSPLEGVAIRASYGTGFLPPSINQIVINGSGPTSDFLTDPARGESSGFVTYSSTFGGNPDLAPEESESLSIGAVFTPAVLPGLRLSIDYTRIEKVGEVTTLDAQTLLFLEELFPGRITRGPNLPGDPPGWAGPITAIDTTLLNLAHTDVQAYDLQVDYDLRTEDRGSFHFYAIGTYATDFERLPIPGATVVERVGFSGGPLEWRGNLGVTWEAGSWAFAWNAQYYDSYLAYTPEMDPFLRDLVVTHQGSDTIPSQTYHDVSLRYQVDEGHPAWFAGLEVTLGILNLFDESPPILATTLTNGGYSTYGDPRLRRFALTLRKSF